MSRLNKRAIYQLACQTQTSEDKRTAPANQPTHSAEDQVSARESVNFLPLALETLPDGRLLGNFSASRAQKSEHSDAVTVSHKARALEPERLTPREIRRAEVLKKLGSGSLGLLTSAYLQQQVMVDEEFHTVQQKFYGLHAV